MDNFKGTPGPWSYEGGNNENCEVQAKDTTIDLTRCDRNTGEHVISREEMEANARLIAAAPDLLSALQACKYAMEHGDPAEQSTRVVWDGIINHADYTINQALEKDE